MRVSERSAESGTVHHRLLTPENAYQRWKNLVHGKHYKELWNSINWKGEFETPPRTGAKPSDSQFCEHFSQLLNQPMRHTGVSVPITNVYMAVLDDPILEGEITEAIATLNGSKAAGVDGIPPRALKLLKGEWLTIVTYLFNIVFENGSYPERSGICLRCLQFSKKEALKIQIITEE